jgi:hypothetical protein
MPVIRNEFTAKEEEAMRQKRRADNDNDAAILRQPRGYDRNAIRPENLVQFPHVEEES